MKKTITLTLIGAASALALSATGAAAQDRWNNHDRGHNQSERGYNQGGWISINQRQAQLDRRIDMGVQRGDLNRREARRLRMEFNQIAQLESRYRHNGLSNSERADLDRRFDRLAAQIRWERRDNQYGYGYGHERR